MLLLVIIKCLIFLESNNADHFVKRYNLRSLIHSQILEGSKDLIRFFKDHIVEVKKVKNGQ